MCFSLGACVGVCVCVHGCVGHHARLRQCLCEPLCVIVSKKTNKILVQGIPLQALIFRENCLPRLDAARYTDGVDVFFPC